MADDLINIGIVGGYASGKATVLNALFKAPCFEMKSHTHNHTIIEIKASKTSQMSWYYRSSDSEAWKKNPKDIRLSHQYRQIAVEIPSYHFNKTIFCDFPQINDLDSWKDLYLSKVRLMDYVVYVLDAEYALSAKNHDIVHLLCDNCKNLVIVLNKSDVVDDVKELNTYFKKFCMPSQKTIPVFSISAQLELDRCLHATKRMETFAFTESRRNVMTLCDLAFANFRVWLYEMINKRKN